MLKKFELDFLAADLAAVEALLSSRREVDDPIGFLQYTSRKAVIEEELQRVSSRPDLHAQLGIFLGIGPVQHAHGIDVDFAAKALDDIRALITEIVANSAAHEPGKLARVDFTDRSSVLVMDMVQGSMGFILEEAIDATRSTATPASTWPGALVDTLAFIGSGENAIVDKAIAALDKGLLVCLRRFFVRLDERRATLRIVWEVRDLVLDAQAVALACRRLRNMVDDDTGLNRRGLRIGDTSDV